jgi:hypothetical protein
MEKLDKFVMLRISTSDAEKIGELKDRWGVSRGDVLRMLLRDAANRSGARPPVLEREQDGGMNQNGKSNVEH